MTTAMHRAAHRFLLAALLGIAMAPARAGMLPHHDLCSLWLLSEAVIEATLVVDRTRPGGPWQATVVASHKGPLAIGATVAVDPSLVRLAVDFTDLPAGDPRAGRGLLFLVRHAGGWQLAASGLRLIGGDAVLRPHQMINPGGYWLTPQTAAEFIDQAGAYTPDLARRDLAAAGRRAEGFAAARAGGDPEALVPFLSRPCDRTPAGRDLSAALMQDVIATEAGKLIADRCPPERVFALLLAEDDAQGGSYWRSGRAALAGGFATAERHRWLWRRFVGADAVADTAAWRLALRLLGWNTSIGLSGDELTAWRRSMSSGIAARLRADDDDGRRRALIDLWRHYPAAATHWWMRGDQRGSERVTHDPAGLAWLVGILADPRWAGVRPELEALQRAFDPLGAYDRTHGDGLYLEVAPSGDHGDEPYPSFSIAVLDGDSFKRLRRVPALVAVALDGDAAGTVHRAGTDAASQARWDDLLRRGGDFSMSTTPYARGFATPLPAGRYAFHLETTWERDGRTVTWRCPAAVADYPAPRR